MPLGVSVGFKKFRIARHHATFAHSRRELFDLLISARHLVIHFGLERDPFTVFPIDRRDFRLGLVELDGRRFRIVVDERGEQALAPLVVGL